MISNFHSHTTRCGHALSSEREYIETAIKAGIKNFGFSDHAPHFMGEFGSYSMRMKGEQFDDYCKTILSLKEEYKKDINIFLGLELEYFPQRFNSLYNRYVESGVEYLILGQHYLGDFDGAWSGTPTDRVDFLDMYTDAVLEAISTKKFAYIAHPDLFNFTGDIDTLNERYNKICKEAKKYDIPLEFNFLGFDTNRIYPSKNFFTLASKNNNKIIYGIDAHELNIISRVNEIEKKADEFLFPLHLERVNSIKLLNGKIV